MDPSNNNSFGSSTQTPGAIVSGGDTAVDNTAAGGSGGGFTSANFPSSGISVGDKPEPRKGLIIGIIIAFVLLLGGGLIALAATGGVFGGSNNPGNSQQGSNASAREVFNQYINYVANGEDSSADISNATIIDLNMPYFSQVEINERGEYLEKIRSLSEKLSGSLSEDYSVELSDMNLYFISFAEFYPMEMFDVGELFLKNGYENAKEAILAHYTAEIADPVFEVYIDAARDLALFELEIISSAAKAGCVENGVMRNNCYIMTEDEGMQYDEKINREREQEGLLSENALDAANAIYNSVYASNGGSNE